MKKQAVAILFLVLIPSTGAETFQAFTWGVDDAISYGFDGRGICRDALDNTYIAGSGGGVILLKFDSTWALKWSLRITGSLSATSFDSVTVGENGNVYLGFMNTSHPTMPIIAEISPKGETVRCRAFVNISEEVTSDGYSYDGAEIDGIAACEDGSIVVSIGGWNLPEVFIVKLDSDLDLIWQVRISDIGVVRSLEIDDDCLYLLTNKNGAESGPILTKLTRDGGIIWSRMYSFGQLSKSYPQTHDLACDGAGNLYVTGGYSPGGIDDNSFILKVTADDGNFLWKRAWNVSITVTLFCITIARGEVYAAGEFKRKAAILHLSPDGELKETSILNSTYTQIIAAAEKSEVFTGATYLIGIIGGKSINSISGGGLIPLNVTRLQLNLAFDTPNLYLGTFSTENQQIEGRVNFGVGEILVVTAKSNLVGGIIDLTPIQSLQIKTAYFVIATAVIIALTHWKRIEKLKEKQ